MTSNITELSQMFQLNNYLYITNHFPTSLNNYDKKLTNKKDGLKESIITT